jgi:hypothetical protein
MKQKKYHEHPSKAASEVAREYRGVDVRGFIKYINTLVAKKILPQELKAEYIKEEWSFKNFVNQIQERELSSNELKRREEIAKDYVTREEIERDMTKLLDQMNRISDKIDKLATKTYFQE